MRLSRVLERLKRCCGMWSKDEIDAVKAEYLFDELEPAPEQEQKLQGVGWPLYVCPACGHSRVVRPTKAGIWYCQHCHEKGSIFDVVRLRDGLTIEQAFDYVMRKYGRRGTEPKRKTAPKVLPSLQMTVNGQGIAAARDGWAAECQRYLTAAAAALPGSAGEVYMRGRGFTTDTLKRFCVGFDPRARAHGALKYGRPAVVYPYSLRLDYYGARLLRPIEYNADEKTEVIKALKVPSDIAGSEPLFNAEALYSHADVVIVEGAFDAMAIAQGAASCGADVGAVALCGTASSRLVKALQAKSTQARLWIALDNDEAGQNGARAAAAALDAIGQRFEVIDSAAAYGGFKDACALQEYDAGLMADCVQNILDNPEIRL